MEELLDKYYNHKSLMRGLNRDIWGKGFKMLNDKYDEVGEFQPFTYLFVFICMFFTCLYYTIPYILQNIVIGKRHDIYASPEEIAERQAKRQMLENGIDYNEEVYNREQRKTVKIKEEKQRALEVLRNVLTSNDDILTGEIISTQFPKISEEELLTYVNTGKTNRPFMVQRVTFGNDINKALKILFSGSVKHRKIRGEEETYLVFETESVLDLEKRIQDLFVNENIRITLHNRKKYDRMD